MTAAGASNADSDADVEDVARGDLVKVVSVEEDSEGGGFMVLGVNAKTEWTRVSSKLRVNEDARSDCIQEYSW